MPPSDFDSADLINAVMQCLDDPGHDLKRALELTSAEVLALGRHTSARVN